MLRVDQLRLSPGQKESALRAKAAKLLHISSDEIRSLQILRRAVDAREELTFVYTVALEVNREETVLRRCRDRRVSTYHPQPYLPPVPQSAPELPPIVVGAGPAGLFAALLLALAGQRPILIERGRAAEDRVGDVERFWKTGVLDTESNVQFGEGGAGAFSDGKLNTGTKDPRHRWILEQLVSCGAPESILIDAKPHVGTDYLHIVLLQMRQKLLALGGEIRFSHRLEAIHHEAGALTAISVRHGDEILRLPCRQLVLALGHSARDTVEALYGCGLQMEAKPFAMGVRIEHRQDSIDAVQYGKFAGHPSLGAATYKLSCHLPNGRSAFSFCVCPGGEVVAAASESGRAVTNGMSEYARDKENINGALLVNVTPADFPTDHPLSGIALQRQLEEAAFTLGGGGYLAPCQRVEDFLAHRPSSGPGSVSPSYRPGVTWCDLHDCLPPFIAETLELALPLLNQKLPGYAAADALLTAVESRSSSPVRIPRDDTYQSNIRGVYPCGEGAGYAGGILSAAADGMRCAEHILGGQS